MRPVVNKLDGMRRWHAGEFGNKLRTWTNPPGLPPSNCPALGQAIRDGYERGLGLRYSDPRGGGACFVAHLNRWAAQIELEKWLVAGRNMQYVTVCEEAPDHRLIMNGEYHDLYGFHFSRVKKPMRAALKEGGRFAEVPRARLMLRQCMTPSSWADFEALTELYPGHVIELSVYECTLGVLPGRNTIVWEVRKY